MEIIQNRIKIPVKALTVNKVWQGKRFKTPLYKQYEKDCSWFLKAPLIKGEVEVNYKFYIKYFSTSDVDNFIKPLQDILVKNRLIEDDCKIKKITAEKIKSEEEWIEVEIKGLN
jgi:Holliday junction resolvase RusA-like endonuclease